MVEPEREDRVARLQHGEVDGHVRLGAGVRLDVRVLGAEERLRAVDRELLDLVDDLAAAVVALARIALGVLVRRHAADRLEHARPGEVLGRDQLDLAALALELAAEQLRDLGVDGRRGRPCGAARASPARPPSDLLVLAAAPGAPTCRGVRRGAPPPARHRPPPPRSTTRGSAPVKSSTVEGVPGARRRRRLRARGLADLGRDVVEAAGSGPPGGSRSSPARADDLEHGLRFRPGGAGRGRRSSLGGRRSATEPSPRVREHERVRARAAGRGRSCRRARAAPARTRGACRRSRRGAPAGVAVPGPSAREPGGRGRPRRVRAEPVDRVGRRTSFPRPDRRHGARFVDSLIRRARRTDRAARMTRARPSPAAVGESRVSRREHSDACPRRAVAAASGGDPMSAKPSLASPAPRRAPPPSATSSTRRRRGDSVRPPPRARRAAPSRGSRAERLDLRRGDVRRVRDHEVPRAAGRPRRGPPGSRPPSRPVLARSRVRASSASAERSTPVTRAPGCSSAIASAIAPFRCRRRARAAAVEPVEQREAALDDDLRLGPRDQRARSTVSVSRRKPHSPST